MSFSSETVAIQLRKNIFRTILSDPGQASWVGRLAGIVRPVAEAPEMIVRIDVISRDSKVF
jgi:hypothetical protein